VGWVHDTDYAPACEHEGYPAAVLDDGTETSVHTEPIRIRVSGWRAACECGWRGTQFWPRSAFRGWTSSIAPDEVAGFATGHGAYGEWFEHLHAVLPGLAVHDAAQELADARETLDQAVATARASGASWTLIGNAAGITRQAAHERWGVAYPAPPRTTGTTTRSAR